MRKTKLAEYKRDIILKWMLSNNQGPVKALETTAKDAGKAALELIVTHLAETYYPATDMEVLKKYHCTRLDECVRFSGDGTGYGVYAIEIPWNWKRDTEHNPDGLQFVYPEVPSGSGCKIYQGTDAIKAAVDAFNAAKVAYFDYNDKKKSEYRGFLSACKYVEDIEEVIVLPDELRTQMYGEQRALAVVNPEIIANIRNDFNKENTNV